MLEVTVSADRDADPVVYTVYARFTGNGVESIEGPLWLQASGDDPCDAFNALVTLVNEVMEI